MRPILHGNHLPWLAGFLGQTLQVCYRISLLFLLLNLIWGLTHNRALKFLVMHTFDYAELVPLEIVPPNSPVPLEVMPHLPRDHHDPFFASSYKVVGDLLALIPTSYDLLLMLFAILLNSKIQTLT
jgi:hypothetical protein